jgi:hypothetical protein
MNLDAALQHIVENGPNPTEFLLLSACAAPDDKLDTSKYLESWALAFSHRLRGSNRRNPAQQLDRAEAQLFIQQRLERDIVFNTDGLGAEESAELASAIIETIDLAQAAAITFPIEDWTYSDVLVAAGKDLVLLLAFLGED